MIIRMGNQQFRFPTRSDTNQPVQAQENVRSLKFRIEEEEELYYPCSENKGADHSFSHMQIVGFLVQLLKWWYTSICFLWNVQNFAHKFFMFGAQCMFWVKNKQDRYIPAYYSFSI